MALAFVPWVLPMGRGKIERKWFFSWEEHKRKERVRYCRLQEDTKRVRVRAKKKEATQEKRERAAKSEPLREKKTVKRELCMKKKIERRE